MPGEVQMTVPVLKVLRAFVDAPHEQHYGLEVMRSAGLKSGTLYPVLARLERASWIIGRWEEPGAGRPPRRYYVLTEDGLAMARHALADAYRDLAPTQQGGSVRPATGHA